MPRIISINVGQPTAVKAMGGAGVEHLVVTGIFKKPVKGPVVVRAWGLENDGQADTRVFNGQQIHGGALKAVYLYPVEHYATWSAELGRELPFGQFGENVSADGILEDHVRVGDVLAIGDVRLQVTEPRGPCYKLDIRMGIPEFKEQMRRSGRTGFYARVLAEGSIEAGDEIVTLESDSSQPTILEVHRSGG